MKILSRIVLGVVLVVLMAGLGSWFWLRSKNPTVEGNLKLAGLQAPVDVYYDAYGIPHLYAQNEEDLFQAFGYVHAQDRLFQMEMIRRLADGRLAEVFGAKALPSDRFFRTLSFRHYAKRTLDSVYHTQPNAPFVRAAQAYINGINQYIENGPTPVEFTLTGIPKQPFTLEDIEIIEAYMGYSFSEAFRSESVFTTIAEKLGPAYLADISGEWPTDEPMIPTQHTPNPPFSDGDTLAAESLAQVADFVSSLSMPFPPYHGSNGWVISGKKTKSGKPILSNDTHIGFAQPSVWYEAHLNAPGFNFYGSFLAGTPFGALGHNEHGGWGLTMFENDDVDFYREKLNPANAGQVWYKDHWETMTIRKETIPVKDTTSVSLEVKQTRHGILIQEVHDRLKNFKQQPIALWWTFYQFPSRLSEAFYELSHSRTSADARKAVAKIHAPGLNVMWGDTQGNIAWWASARLPIRPAGVKSYLIQDGSTGASDPTGWYGFDQNPQIENPERGVLYTANNQPADMGNGLVPGYYVPGDRARRIEQLLFTDKKNWTPEEVRAVMSDVINPMVPALLKDILPVIKPAGKKQVELHRKLLAWNGAHELTNTEPALFYRFLYHVYERSITDELGDVAAKFLNNVSFKRNMAHWMRNDASPWWDNRYTPQKETRQQVFTHAFGQAVKDLEKQLGDDPATWTWDRVHTIEYNHPLAVAGPTLAKLFNVGPYAVPGGRETINNLDFDVDSTGLYKVRYGPALRRVVDFGNPLNGSGCLPTGQSGVRTSPHYQDQAELYVTGKSRPEWMDKQTIQQAKETRKLTFQPR